MRDRSSTISPMTQIDTCIEVSVHRMATLPATKHLFVPLSFLSESTTGASEASAGWIQQNNRHAMNRGKQLDPASKVTSGPLLPANHPCWVFQADASARALTHGDSGSGFFGNQLSRRTGRVRALNPSALLVCSSLLLLLQDRSQIRTSVTIAAGNGGSHAHVTTKPPFGFLDLGQWNTHRHTGVPFVVAPIDLCRLIQLRTGEHQRAIDGLVSAGRNIEPTILPSAGRRAPKHDPTVKARSFAGLLDFGRVNQLRFQRTGCVTSLCGSPIVDVRTPVGSPDELAHPFRRREIGRAHV